MHEMALMQSMLAGIEAEAKTQAFSRVDRVCLQVGALSCVDPHALEFGFEAVTRGTLADGAALEIEQVPGQARCFACEADVIIEERGRGCPKCGSHQLLVTGGEELKIKELEVQ